MCVEWKKKNVCYVFKKKNACYVCQKILCVMCVYVCGMILISCVYTFMCDSDLVCNCMCM